MTIRTVTVSAATAALTIAFTTALTLLAGAGLRPAFAGTQAVVPPCPQAKYGADGNMSPLFCVVDNPAALQAFASTGKRTFALGRNATPAQVTAALAADYESGGTGPIMCSIYRLAAWRNHWSFGASPAEAAGIVGCANPSFPNVN